MRDEPFDKLRTALVEVRASALRQAPGVRGSGDVLEEPLAVDRLVIFSDAVFAIAATLFVLDIRIPPGLDSAEFHRALRGQLAAIVTYALSFAVIGQLWLTHHRLCPSRSSRIRLRSSSGSCCCPPASAVTRRITDRHE
jgi:Endosomal/lysosomal potassium channel TMEM175